MTKTYYRTKKGLAKVTFDLPKGTGAHSAQVLGDFNNWDPKATPMKRKRDGSFSTTLNLEAGREYRYKYWLDGERWENDNQADGSVPNVFGTIDSVIHV